jgi:hypothetical protein
MVIDGNPYFKRAAIRALQSLDLLDAFHCLRTGKLYMTRRFLLTNADLECVSETIRDRTYINYRKR